MGAGAALSLESWYSSVSAANQRSTFIADTRRALSLSLSLKPLIPLVFRWFGFERTGGWLRNGVCAWRCRKDHAEYDPVEDVVLIYLGILKNVNSWRRASRSSCRRSCRCYSLARSSLLLTNTILLQRLPDISLALISCWRKASCCRRSCLYSCIIIASTIGSWRRALSRSLRLFNLIFVCLAVSSVRRCLSRSCRRWSLVSFFRISDVSLFSSFFWAWSWSFSSVAC